MTIENLKILKDKLIKKGNDIKAFNDELRKNRIGQNRKGNGLPEKFSEYAKVFEIMLERSKTENFFWEYCSFETYKQCYASRYDKFIETNDEADELFFSHKDYSYYNRLMKGHILINNDDPLTITHNPDTIWSGYFGEICESKKRWINIQQGLKIAFIQSRIAICKKKNKIIVEKTINFDPFNTVILRGLKTNFTKSQKEALYNHAITKKYFDCSKKNFFAFLSEQIMTDRLIWLKKNLSNKTNKAALYEFMDKMTEETMNAKMFKKVESIICDEEGEGILIYKPSKGEQSAFFKEIKEINQINYNK